MASSSSEPLRVGLTAPMVATMDDKSPKAKPRDQKHRVAAKVQGAVAAESKQEGYSRAASPVLKDRK